MRAQFVLLVAVAALIYSSRAESPVPEEPPQLPVDPVDQGEVPPPELAVDPVDQGKLPPPELAVDPVDQGEVPPPELAVDPVDQGEVPPPELAVDPVDHAVPVEEEETKLPCAFPFTYKGEQYDACTMVDSVIHVKWCSTATVYNENEWRYCTKDEILGGSEEEEEKEPVEVACVLPFQYNGEEYPSCTTDGSYLGKSWCATTNNYPEDGEWKYCSPEEELLGEKKTPPAPEECVFPFTYEGVEYNECTTEGSSWGSAWCATTDNLEENPSDYMYC